MGIGHGYKRTEAGVIPEDWNVSTIGKEFDVQLGKMIDTSKNSGYDKPYIGNKAVRWHHIDVYDLSTVPLSTLEIKKYRLVKGDLLVCEGGEIGRAAIWDAPINECYYQKALHRLRPMNNYNVKLMLAYFQHWVMQGLLYCYATQTSIAHLPREMLIQIPLPVPPKQEQSDIAEALSDVDSLLDALERLIAKKRDIKQAAMQQLLTGKIRLPGFKDSWITKPLNQLVQIKMGQSPNSKFYNSNGDGLPLVQGNADLDSHRIVAKNWTTQSIKIGEKGDLVLTVRAPVGAVGVITERCCLGRGVCSLHAENIDSIFLFQSLLCFERQWESMEQGSTFTSINSTQLANFELTTPSSLAEQFAIGSILTDMDTEIDALEVRIQKACVLKQAMMQELLTGKTRLVKPEARHAGKTAS